MSQSSGLQRAIGIASAAAVCAAALAVPAAQQTAPIKKSYPLVRDHARGRFPPGRRWRLYNSPPLGEDRGSSRPTSSASIKVSVVTKGLSHPWSVAFLPGGDMLITERVGRLRVVRANGVLDPAPVPGIPAVTSIVDDGRPDGHRAAPALRREPVGVHLVPQAARHGARRQRQGLSRRQQRHHARALERQDARRPQRHLRLGRRGHGDVAHRVRARRHALHDHRRPRHRPGRQPRPAAARQRRCRQDSAHDGRGQGAARQPVRRQGRLQALHLHDGPPHPARAGAEPVHRGDVGRRAGAQRRRRSEHPEAGPQLRLAVRDRRARLSRSLPDAGAAPRRHGAARTFSGCRRLPCRAWRSTPAIASRTGGATCSSAGCARARSRGPGSSSASSSTTTGTSCAASRCCAICTSASATCGRAPTACSTC